jgi:hypothetical protein
VTAVPLRSNRDFMLLQAAQTAFERWVAHDGDRNLTPAVKPRRSTPSGAYRQAEADP